MNHSLRAKENSTAGNPADICAATNTDPMDAGVWKTAEGLHQIIDALPFLVCFIDQDQKLRFCNKHFEEWFQKPLSQLEGRCMEEIFSPPIYRSVFPDFEKAMSGRRFSSEATLEFPDGITRRVRRTYIPCKSEDGEQIGCFSLVQDVTELVETQVELGRERDLFEGIFRAMPDAMALLSANREIFMSNPALSRQFGYRSDEILGRETEFLYHSHGEYERKNLIGSKALENNGVPQTVKYKQKNGEVFTGETRSAAIHDRNGRFIANLEIMRDNSAREKIEQHRAQSQKMEAIGDVTGAIAHDFNNLLMVISGYARRAISHREDGEALMNDLNTILNTADKAARLTAQMLTFSHHQIMDRSLFRVDEHLAKAETAMLSTLDKNHDLRLVMSDRGHKVDTDANEFNQAICKLVDNARDATPDGGTIEISTHLVTIDHTAQATLQYLLPGQYIRIDVTDSGHGISPAILPRVFEPFFTTKQDVDGSGLSLAMVYGFAQQSRGGVEIQSTPGQGTTVQLYLPTTAEDADSAKAAADSSGKGETILLVEDDEALLDLTQDILSDLGYNVLTASDGLKALVLEENYEGDIDLMLSDVVMPGMGGYDLAEAIRGHRPNMKMAFMSGYNNRNNRCAEMPDRSHFLQKPVAIDRLAQTIRSALDSLSPPAG